ncbi:MAG: hypothetical protein ACI8ZB_004350 [Desulforhopalus sp.]|jgi:hypothetical protein
MYPFITARKWTFRLKGIFFTPQAVGAVTWINETLIPLVALTMIKRISEGETLLSYRVRNGNVKFITNAFFFQEGQVKTYDAAWYCLLRVNDKGELLLTSMYDEDFNKLEQSIKPASN